MIRFSRYIWLYCIISSLVLVPGIYALLSWGLRPSIDFTGGTLLELRFDSPLVEEQFIQKVRSEAKQEKVNITKSGNHVIVRLRSPANFVDSASGSATIIRNETVGPVIGKELLQKTMVAALFAIVGILLYIAYAFRNIKFGISAIIALVHDLLVVLGVFSLFGRLLQVEVDTLFVTAFLTTMSFSVHDTIVVFDRIREYMRREERQTFWEVTDRALTETMNRSLTNSLAIIFMLLALLLMGGETIRWFVVALLVGTISGTYSSPFIATPVLLLWDNWERRKSNRSR